MKRTMGRAEWDDLKARMASRADDIARALVPGAALKGGKWTGRNPRRDDRHAGSFIVYGRSHARAGSFIDYASSESGDAIDLVAYLKGFPYRNRECALREALDWLGELGGKPDPDKVRAELDRARADAARRARADAAQLERQRRRTLALWKDCRPLAGSLAETYLHAARGIDLARLPDPPGALRFHPGLANWMEPRRPNGGHPTFPSLVAAMSRWGEPIAAIQRTSLAKDGRGKAPVRKAKLIYPSSQGAVIRLSRGVNRCSPEDAARDGLAGETLIICEGAEDALTCVLAWPDARVWACCGVTNIRYVEPGPSVSRVIVAADRDWLGSAARAALDDGLFWLRERVRHVELAFPEEGKDFNAWLTGET